MVLEHVFAYKTIPLFFPLVVRAHIQLLASSFSFRSSGLIGWDITCRRYSDDQVSQSISTKLSEYCR